MPIYPYSFQLPPLNVQDIPNDGAVGEFLGISAGGVLDWLPVASGGGDMLKADNLSGLTSYPTARTNLGLGTGDSPTFANLTLTSPSLASSAPVTISQTWNNAAVVFTGLRVNAVSTASASGSLLLDLQVGGVTQFNVGKTGTTTFSNGAVFSVAAGCDFATNNVTRSGAISFGPSSDVVILRDGAANTLALRNGTAAQTFNVYGTYTSGTSYERLTLSAPSAANAIIGTNKGSGGGTARGLDLHTDGAARMTITTAGNVGIGTTAPGSTLTVAGTFHFGSNNGALIGGTSYGGHLGSTQYFGLRSTSAVSTTIYLQNNSSGDKNAVIRILGSGSGADHGALDINTIESSPILFTTGLSNERMRITAAGNVGIGTTAPRQALDISSSTAGGLWSYLQNTNTGSYSAFAVGNNISATRFSIYTLGSTYPSTGQYQANSTLFESLGDLYYNAPKHVFYAGNVGIGTTSPTSKLHVVGDAFLAANGSNTAPSLRIGAGANINGWYSFGGVQLNAVANSLNSLAITTSGTVITNGYLALGLAADVVLERDAQDELALRRGALGQKFSVYGTYPGAAWERFTITAPTSGNVLLGTYKGTGGIARGLEIQTDGVTRMSLHPTLGTLDLPAVGTSAGVQQINAARIIYAGEGYRVGSTYQVVFSNGTDYSRGLGASSSGGLAVTNGSTGGQSLQFTEMTAPAAPATNSVRIYAEDNGSGKTRLMALFATGVAQQIAIEP